MKILKYSTFLLLPLAMLISCEEDIREDKLTGQNPPASVVDVSERLTGFEQEVTGPGATLTMLGDNLADVKRVMVEGDLANAVVATENSVTFEVPVEVPLGQQTFHFIFSGSERATAVIEVVPRSIVRYVDPLTGVEGDRITAFGDFLGSIESVTIGNLDAPIISQEDNAITFEIPAGAESGQLILAGPSGDLELDEVTVCGPGTEDPLCLTGINPNGGFEAGTPGVINNGGDHGGGWFGQGDNVSYEIVDAAEAGGRGGRGDLTLEVNMTGPVPDNANPWETQFVNTVGDIPGAQYLLSVWVQGPAGTQVNFGVGLGGAPYTNYMYEEVSMTGEWQHVTQLFQTVDPEGNITNASIHFNIPGNAGATFYVDNLKIIPVGDWIDPEANPTLYCETYGANGGGVADELECE